MKGLHILAPSHMEPLLREYLWGLSVTYYPKESPPRDQMDKVWVGYLPEGNLVNQNYYLNVEQLTRGDQRIDPNYKGIWDYSEENILILSSYIPRHLLHHYPYPYNPLEILHLPKVHWFAMVGTRTPRRTRIAESLWGLDWIVGWGRERDVKLMTYRILVNVHWDWDYRILEQIRVNRCIYNGMLVVSEECTFPEILPLREYIYFAPYEGLIQKALWVKENWNSLPKFSKGLGDTD